MDRFDELETRAKTMLPPATVMMIECAGDSTGDPAMVSLLEEVQRKGLEKRPLCDRPCRTERFDDRVLLVCEGCERQKTLPRLAGIGRGSDERQAYRSALYALTLPMDHPNAKRDGCIAAQCYGSGPAEKIVYSCVLNRAAYADISALGAEAR